MKTAQISGLPEAKVIANDDLIMISQIQEDGTFVSKKIKASVLNNTYTTNVTDNYIAVSDDSLLSCSSSKNINITLYLATGSSKTLTIKNMGVGRVFVYTQGFDFIQGVSTRIAINETHSITVADIELGKWSLIYNDT